MKLQINITQEILNKTKNCNSVSGDMGADCAIAEAVRDIFPTAQVSADVIRFLEPSSKGSLFRLRSEEIALPLIASTFIDQFDRKFPHERAKMKPFSFEITIPESIIDDIDISEVEEILKHSPTLQLI